ncbi:MAG TPA: DUF2339 domain-containing protein [Acidisarcina sp.]|nr:DUF2339 domain-containing protein [Acidisarcina sp.]
MPDSAASPTPPGQAATPPPAATVRRPGETPPVPEHIRETGTTTSGVTTSGTAKSGTTAGTKTAGTTRTLEQRIGSQLFNRVGIVAVLFAMAWFLKLAFDRNWIGPPVQIAIGLILAVALALWSERFRHKGYPAFSYTLKALGSGIAYLSLWASFNVYHLVPAAVAFLGMVAVTVTNAYFSWRQRSEVLATYALLGGLVTPGLLSTGEDHEIFLFGYLLLLSVGVVLLADLRSWLRLPVGAFVGTGFYFFAWFGEFYHPPLAALTLTFVALFFVVFSAVPLLTLRSFGSESAPPAASIFLVAAPVAIALLAAIEAYSLVAHPQQAWLRQWIALVLAAASIALSHLARLQPRANVAERKFFVTQEALAAFFVALAIWFHFTGYAIVLGWLGEALAGIAIAFWRPRPGRRELGAAVVVLCFLSLLLLEISDPLHQPVDVVLNAHFATYMAALAAFAVALRISVLGLRHAEQKSVLSWSALAALLTIAFNVVALWSVAFEIHHYWTCGASLAGNLCRVIDPRDLVYSQFAYSGWFMAYGAALMATGFLARSAFLRWQALVLLALAIAKVFLFDASQLSQGYRVASFLALGVVLLAISFAYQHDWLALRRDT